MESIQTSHPSLGDQTCLGEKSAHLRMRLRTNMASWFATFEKLGEQENWIQRLPIMQSTMLSLAMCSTSWVPLDITPASRKRLLPSIRRALPQANSLQMPSPIVRVLKLRKRSVRHQKSLKRRPTKSVMRLWRTLEKQVGRELDRPRK